MKREYEEEQNKKKEKEQAVTTLISETLSLLSFRN